ncbi:hypothetical protein GCM10023205_38220 [Yinghuangia aomiensis]|uniref:Leucine-binding protein domain-containing protein n=1 Tax=Yinghuangia aomiensis TaxID=676205 RepID=A0ABP9HF50_9ACTN
MTPTIRRPLRRAGAAAAALALSLAAAACTIEDKDKATAPGAAPGAARTDTPGVTADSIKLGISYPDYAAVKSFVNIDQGDFEATYKALIDKINAAGGIQGRKIVPVFAKTSLVSPAAAQEACVKLTQDEKVFAVVNLMPGNAQVPCYTQTNRTAVIGSPLDPDMNAAGQAPWFSFDTGLIARKSVEAFAARGDLAGHKIAIATVSNDQAQTDAQVLPALQAAGITPVANGTITLNGADPAALGQQAGVLFQKAQATGADTLLMVGGAAQIIPQVLEKTTWRPRLLFTVVPAGYTTGKGQHDFGTLKDAAAGSQIVDWSDPALTACADTVTQADPSLAGKLVDPATVGGGAPTPGASMASACRNLALFKAIADKAGPTLDYTTFRQAGNSLGRFHIPGFREDANYGPNTPDGAIPVRATVYDQAGNQFVPAAN